MRPRSRRSCRRFRPPWPNAVPVGIATKDKGPPEQGGPLRVRDSSMNDDLEALKTSTDAALAAATDLRAWDAVRIAVLGRNGSLTSMLRDLGKTPPEQRKDRGAALNRLKNALTAAIEARKTELEDAALDARLLSERIDPSLPPRPRDTGLIHPIARTMEEIAAIFGAMG